jgi:hypothetical protein
MTKHDETIENKKNKKRGTPLFFIFMYETIKIENNHRAR